jgi:hypothetical protein
MFHAGFITLLTLAFKNNRRYWTKVSLKTLNDCTNNRSSTIRPMLTPVMGSFIEGESTRLMTRLPSRMSRVQAIR